MRLVKKLSMSMLALAFMASVSLAGEITGTVTGKDDKPAAGAQVRLMKAAGGGAKKADKAPAAQADAEKKPGEKKPAAQPLQKTETDAAGKFTFKDVEDGAYRVAAGNKDLGTGNAQVKVMGGKSEPVSIKLAEPKPKAPAK